MRDTRQQEQLLEDAAELVRLLKDDRDGLQRRVQRLQTDLEALKDAGEGRKGLYLDPCPIPRPLPQPLPIPRPLPLPLPYP